jgi:hypothetical protein
LLKKLFRHFFVAHYAFETPEFGLNENGLHRLRSRFPFESLPYTAITQAEVKRGKTVQNWWLLLAFGVLCLGLAGYVAYGIFWFFKFGHGRITIQEIVVPIIPAFLGIAASRQALRVDDILLIHAGRRKLLFPLNKLTAGELPALAYYLAARIRGN